MVKRDKSAASPGESPPLRGLAEPGSRAIPEEPRSEALHVLSTAGGVEVDEQPPFPELQPWLEDMRLEAPPSLDWERVEARLFTRIAAGEADLLEARTSHLAPEPAAPAGLIPESSRKQTSGAPAWRWAALAAAAALLITGAFALQSPGTEPHPASSRETTKLDGDQLEVGRLIKSEGSPLVVEHAGRARWTLAPQGRARLVSAGRYLTIRLEQGEILAEVVPRGEPESFAIQAGETRVAVRGTEFRVDLHEQEARVRVARGVVVVGEAGDPGDTDGWLLTAPAAGVFSLDGAKRATHLEGSVAAPTAAAEPVVGKIASTSKPAAPSSSEPKAASLSLDAALGHVSAAAQTCFADHTPAGGGVRVSATTQLKLQLHADGKLQAVSFAPPLSPTVQACVQGRVQGLVVTPGAKRDASRRVTLGQTK